MMRRARPLLAAAMLPLFVGCATQQNNQAQSEALGNESRAKLRPVPAQEINPVRHIDQAVLPMVAVKEDSSWWLSNKRVRLVNEKRRALSLTEVVRMFFEQGINISSSIPLDSYTYAGLGVQDMDAETALGTILGAVGLDYEVDDIARTVLIRPMASRSWKINLGDRKTSFSASGGGSNSGNNNLNSGNTGNGASGSNPASPMSGGSSGSGMSGTDSASGAGSNLLGSGQEAGSNLGSGSSNQSGASITSNDDFWASMRAELKERMEVLLPGVATSASDLDGARGAGPMVPAPMPLTRAPGAGNVGGNGAGQVADFYVKKRIGTFSINPVTGYVTVQAPRWLLKDLDKYIKRIQAENNYRITFVGEMVLVTTNNSNSEGLDISSFARFANSRYGIAYSNNALGGVTVNFAEGSSIPAIKSGGQAVAGTLLGVRSPLDGLQIFNAYLQNYGTVNIVQRPILVTSNGVPGYFSRTSRKYFVQYNQVAASGGTGGAAVGTQNQLVPFDFGTTLTINAHYDSEADIIRAGIVLDQVVQAGTQTINQQVSSTAGQQATVPQDIPLPATFKYRGEVPLRDGDMIVIGGQSEDQQNTSDGGVTGLKNGPLGALFGQQSRSKEAGTYYFALRVKLTKSE